MNDRLRSFSDLPTLDAKLRPFPFPPFIRRWGFSVHGFSVWAVALGNIRVKSFLHRHFCFRDRPLLLLSVLSGFGRRLLLSSEFLNASSWIEMISHHSLACSFGLMKTYMPAYVEAVIFCGWCMRSTIRLLFCSVSMSFHPPHLSPKNTLHCDSISMMKKSQHWPRYCINYNSIT